MSRSAAARVAVVIVNYQSYPELRQCLQSLDVERFEGEVVVVDHSSHAGHAASIRAEFPQVNLLTSDDNEGFAAGVNRGAGATSAPYLLLLNPDCSAPPDLCRRLAEWMDAHERVGVAGPRILNRDGSVQASARRFPDLTTGIAGRSSWLTRRFPGNPLSRHNLAPSLRPEDTPRAVDWVSGAAMIVRREAFEAVGGMDDGFFLYWEDADFCRRLSRAGWGVMYVPSISVRHDGSGSSRHAADASLVAFHRSAFRLFWKHARPPARVLAPLVFAGLQARLAIIRRLVRRRR